MKNVKSFVVSLFWMVVIFAIPSIALAAQDEAPGVTGTWLGTLKIQGIELRIVFHFTKKEDGSLEASLDSPDQGAAGIAVDEVTFEENEIGLKVRRLNVDYTGTLSKDGETISGTFKQRSAEMPLVLKRVEEVPELE